MKSNDIAAQDQPIRADGQSYLEAYGQVQPETNSNSDHPPVASVFSAAQKTKISQTNASRKAFQDLPVGMEQPYISSSALQHLTSGSGSRSEQMSLGNPLTPRFDDPLVGKSSREQPKTKKDSPNYDRQRSVFGSSTGAEPPSLRKSPIGHSVDQQGPDQAAASRLKSNNNTSQLLASANTYNTQQSSPKVSSTKSPLSLPQGHNNIPDSNAAYPLASQRTQFQSKQTGVTKSTQHGQHSSGSIDGQQSHRADTQQHLNPVKGQHETVPVHPAQRSHKALTQNKHQAGGPQQNHSSTPQQHQSTAAEQQLTPATPRANTSKDAPPPLETDSHASNSGNNNGSKAPKLTTKPVGSGKEAISDDDSDDEASSGQYHNQSEEDTQYRDESASYENKEEQNSSWDANYNEDGEYQEDYQYDRYSRDFDHYEHQHNEEGHDNWNEDEEQYQVQDGQNNDHWNHEMSHHPDQQYEHQHDTHEQHDEYWSHEHDQYQHEQNQEQDHYWNSEQHQQHYQHNQDYEQY